MTNDQSTMTNDHPTTHRTRAFLQVQDGCENRCTYCIVRLLRGPGRSVPLENVVAQVQALVEAGFQEVVLTGINLGAYGRDLGMTNGLYRLVETLLALGANSKEASSSMLRASFRASLIPTLSSMSGMGIVFIPGMMTGQILGGVQPLAAIRYQVVIMMAILGAVAFSSYMILFLEQRKFFDEYHLLREEIFT